MRLFCQKTWWKNGIECHGNVEEVNKNWLVSGMYKPVFYLYESSLRKTSVSLNVKKD